MTGAGPYTSGRARNWTKMVVESIQDPIQNNSMRGRR
jgi:hypothetical protein